MIVIPPSLEGYITNQPYMAAKPYSSPKLLRHDFQVQTSSLSLWQFNIYISHSLESEDSDCQSDTYMFICNSIYLKNEDCLSICSLTIW